MNKITLKNITKKYHTLSKEIIALDNISLNIKDKEITSIIGPSGCGKSTILNIISGLDKDYLGTVKSNDKLVIGYMMQTDNLLPWLTVYENAILGLKIKKINNKENIKYVDDLLKKYDLYDFKNQYPNNLSGGMRQRLSLIRTLAIKPNILLLDEPLSKLDINSKAKTLDDIYKIIKDLNITTILITHDITEAVTISNNIIVLTKRPGKIKKSYILKNNDLLPSMKRNENYYIKIIQNIWRDIYE